MNDSKGVEWRSGKPRAAQLSADAVAVLDKIDVSDPESAHADADRILLSLVDPTVREAYKRLSERSPWWAFA